MSAAVRAGYKLTEVGVIPAEWDCQLLDTITKRGSGHTPDKTHPEYWGGNIKWISLKDSSVLDQLFIDETAACVTPAGIANSSAVVHPAGTVVLSRDAGVGKSAIMKCDMAVSQHFIAWQCGSKLDNLFLYYWLQARKPEFERIAMGSTIKTIGLPYFRMLKILSPPLLEQRAIAAALSDVDALLAKQGQLIAKKQGLKQAAMQQLLTGQTRLPGFSGDWDVKKLGDVCNMLKGSGLSKNSINASSLRKCILYGELFTTYGQVIQDVVSRTSSSEGRVSEAGDVLIPGSTTTDGIDLAIASALLESGVALGGDINIVRCDIKSGFIPQFLANYLTHIKKHEIAERAQGTTVVHLYGRDLRDLTVHRPPVAEQTAIATILSDKDTEIAALEVRQTKTRALKQGMMQELLTGKTRLV